MSLMIQGVNVYLTECGAGSPVLFLHGAPDSAELWSGVIEHLRDHYHCFAPDLPGFGRSTAPPDFSCSLENMARFLDELIEGPVFRHRSILWWRTLVRRMGSRGP